MEGPLGAVRRDCITILALYQIPASRGRQHRDEKEIYLQVDLNEQVYVVGYFREARRDDHHDLAWTIRYILLTCQKQQKGERGSV